MPELRAGTRGLPKIRRSIMLGHVSFGVSDLERSVAFYDAALAPLGLTRVWTNPDAVGYGYPGQGDLLALKKQSGAIRPPGPGFQLSKKTFIQKCPRLFHKVKGL